MRFINTSTLGFQDVADSDLDTLENGYAILSHRWGNEEILYADVPVTLDADTKSGYAKVKGSCDMARQLGFDLIWIDSCCINKTDAVEIGEAINSMYYWYSKAKMCIVYLEDVQSASKAAQSVWFERGWTLQELIAPRVVQFYSQSWEYLGNKDSLSTTLEKRTGIPANVLNNTIPPQDCSIAQRMSWAAKRTTTRIEDRAYCLMGLFSVNMSMIYGERERAFIRLQNKIIEKSTDESIFAWRLDILEDSTRRPRDVTCGLLAPSPACFADCGDLVSTGSSRGFRIDQYGLSISVPAKYYRLGTFLALLNVTNAQTDQKYAILLSKLPYSEATEELYARVGTLTDESFLMMESSDEKVMQFMIPLNPKGTPAIIFPGFWLRKVDVYDSPIVHHVILSRGQTDEDRVKLADRTVGTAGIMMFRLRDTLDPGGHAWIKFGFDAECRPVCFLTFPPPGGEDPIAKHFAQALKTEYGSPGRIYHPLFGNGWLSEAPSSSSTHDSMKFLSYSFDSRKNPFPEDVNAPIELNHHTHTYSISITMTKQPDLSLYGEDLQKKSHVWTVDVTAKYRSHGAIPYFSFRDFIYKRKKKRHYSW